MGRPRKDSAYVSADQIILPVATRMFAERGYAGTSLRDVIGECGLAMGTPYHHFGNKRGLYLACLEHLFGSVTTRQRDMFRDTPDPAVALRRFILISCETNMDPIISRMIIRELLDDAKVALQTVSMTGLGEEYRALLSVIEQLEGPKAAFAKAFVCHSLVFGVAGMNGVLERLVPEDIRPAVTTPLDMAARIFAALFPDQGAFDAVAI